MNVLQRDDAGSALRNFLFTFPVQHQSDAALHNVSNFFAGMPVSRQGDVWRQGDMADDHLKAFRTLQHTRHQVLDFGFFQIDGVCNVVGQSLRQSARKHECCDCHHFVHFILPNLFNKLAHTARYQQV